MKKRHDENDQRASVSQKEKDYVSVSSGYRSDGNEKESREETGHSCHVLLFSEEFSSSFHVEKRPKTKEEREKIPSVQQKEEEELRGWNFLPLFFYTKNVALDSFLIQRNWKRESIQVIRDE